MIATVRMTGTTPLLMHNSRLADPLDKWAKAMKAVSAKRNKTDDDHAELARLEWMGGIYWSEQTGPYVPVENVVASFYRGGTRAKAGTAIRQAVSFVPSHEGLSWPVIYDGPRDREAMFDDGRFTDRRSVVVSRQRVIRTRPRFDSWSIEGELEIDESVISILDLDRHAKVAGRLIGLGEGRAIGMGRYDVEVS